MQLSVIWLMPGHAGRITRKSGLVRIKTAVPASPAQIYTEAERKGNELQFPFPRRGRRTAFLLHRARDNNIQCLYENKTEK